MNLLKTIAIGAAVTGLFLSTKKVVESFKEMFAYRLPANKLKIKWGLLETQINSTLEVDNYSDFTANMENLYAKISYTDTTGNSNIIATSEPNPNQYKVNANSTTTMELPIMRINNLKLPNTAKAALQQAITGSGFQVFVTVGGRINGTFFETTQRAF